MSKLKVAVIVGSTREQRFSPTSAQWIAKVAAERPEFDVEILDLADYPMGFYGDTTTTTAQAETADKWKTKLREFDAYILTAAEYNHAPTAVLKNAIDYGDWIQKPMGFVGHGGVGGARAVEQLRMIAVEMSSMSVKTGVHILFPDYLAVVKKENTLDDFPHLAEAAKNMLDQLAWWGHALKAARAS
ncbi:MAG TPA: NAD(P)H-dependent oxidoreductase [Ochrobactrum sp.]|nr:NAD(P)H-dependent oxidoreductase [Ochrobactrum sp.]